MLSVGITRALLTRRNLRDARVDMVYYSENQEAEHATNALVANRTALTQNMNVLLLNAKVPRSTRGAQWNELEQRTAKIDGAKKGRNQRLVLLGHRRCLVKGGGGQVFWRAGAFFNKPLMLVCSGREKETQNPILLPLRYCPLLRLCTFVDHSPSRAYSVNA